MSRSNRWEEAALRRIEKEREVVIRPPRKWSPMPIRPFAEPLKGLTAKEAFERLFMPPQAVDISKGRLPK